MVANNTPENQTIALAGIFQATSLCKNLAVYGRCDEEPLAASLDSILKLEADSVEDVFGGTQGLKNGLQVLIAQLGGTNRNRDLDLARYSVALIQLGSNLVNHPNTLDQIQQGIRHATTLEFDITDPTMVNKLAELYRNNISHLSPRIMISGEPEHLNNELIAARIRASLLAGLRSVILWRQCKGSRPGLILNRARYLKCAEQLIDLH